MSRSTIKVREVIERINRAIAQPSQSTDARIALNVVLEGILHHTGNYAGFQYNELNLDALKELGEHRRNSPDSSDTASYIQWLNRHTELQRKAFGDETNRRYYISRKLLDKA